jgi:selenium metabolism protein YedF
MAEKMQNEPSGKACCPGGKSDEDRSNGGKKTLVLLSSDHVGKGDDALGRGIAIGFVKTFKEMVDELWRLVLLNGAVKLAVEGSEALPYLQELNREGIGILVCSRCLETFNLADKKRVGDSANMVDIMTSMQLADKVISLA